MDDEDEAEREEEQPQQESVVEVQEKGRDQDQEQQQQQQQGGRGEEEEFDRILWALKMDLLKVNQSNNNRIHFLRCAIREQQRIDAQRKRKTDEKSHLLSKYNQLLKKQKENKRSSARQKTAKKDEEDCWVPW